MVNGKECVNAEDWKRHRWDVDNVKYILLPRRAVVLSCQDCKTEATFSAYPKSPYNEVNNAE